MKFLLALLAAACLAVTGAFAIERPNIVIVLADDLGWGDPACYNALSKIPTPNIDALAAEGMRFTDAHTPSSVCTPTRYGLLTGRYCWRTRLKSGVLYGYAPALIEPGRATLASILKAQGYATACIGKWHLGFGDKPKTDYAQPLAPGPNSVGFDYFFGIPSSLDIDPYVLVENDHALAQPTENIPASKHQREGGDGYWRGGLATPGFKHADILPTLTEKAEQFIHRQTKDHPFFLYLPLTSPHTPWVPAKAFRGLTGVGDYGDFVAQTDAALGRVLKALDTAGVAGETLVIFTSDNGSNWLPSDIAKWGHRANADWRGQKADIWEGGHRVPFVARWPARIAAGTVSAEPVCLTDLFATVAAITGTALPADAGEDSVDILPALLGEKRAEPLRAAMVHHSIDGTFGIRRGAWKLCMGLGSHGFSVPKKIEPKPGEPTVQLYNLESDPGETRNVAAEQPALVAELTALLERYQSEGRSRP